MKDGRATILCIDDDSGVLSLLRSFLEEHYHLRFALGGRRGLQAIDKQKPDLVLLDIQMPDINGFEVAKQIRTKPALNDVPIIFVTSSLSPKDEQRGLNVGGVDYIHKPISASVLKARIETHLSLTNAKALLNSQHSAIRMLGIACQYSDNDTGAHIWRMAAFSRRLAELYGWSEASAMQLEIAAPMHDIGKIGIPESILKKPGPLTPEEWEVMKQHSQIGFDILSRSSDQIFELAAEIALYHHEKWDGSGYPNGYAGDDIPESARIVAVADVFDALSIRRPYKEAWPMPKVIEALANMKHTHLDAKLVDLFLENLADFLAIRTHWKHKENQSQFSSGISLLLNNRTA